MDILTKSNLDGLAMNLLVPTPQYMLWLEQTCYMYKKNALTDWNWLENVYLRNNTEFTFTTYQMSHEGKKCKKEVVSAHSRLSHIPKRILDYISNYKKGRFTKEELLLVFLVAHENLLQKNLYKTIKFALQSPRTRGVFRRKIETILLRKYGLKGNFSKKFKENNLFQKYLKIEFFNLFYEIQKEQNSQQKKFLFSVEQLIKNHSLFTFSQ